MFAKDKVSQSLIDAVNKVITKEEVKEQLNEAFPTVDDAKKRMAAASGPKPSGGAGIKLGTRYGGGRQADEPEDDEGEKTPAKREKYGARKTRFTNTKLYKEADDCVSEPQAKSIAKKEVDKHEGGMHGKKGEVAKHEKEMHKEELKGNQHKIDANKNGKIDAHDFELLRSKKKKMTEGYAFAERLVESMYGKKSALPIDETEMSDAQKKKKEEIVMSMKKDTAGLKKRYGSRWKDVMYATATKQAMKEDVEVEEEIDPNVRTKDALTGANKPTNRKDDVGPGADGRSSKVKFKGGPMDEEKENEKEDEGHEDEAEDKKLVKKMVKKDALKEEELDELSKGTLGSYIKKATTSVSSNSYRSGYVKGSDTGHNLAVGKKGPQKDHSADSSSALGTARKRQAGIGKAVERLAKENVELDEGIEKKERKLKSFLTMKKEMIGKAGMTSEKKDEE